MKKEKFYKFKNLQFQNIVLKELNIDSFSTTLTTFKTNSDLYSKVVELEVLDIWTIPVYIDVQIYVGGYLVEFNSSNTVTIDGVSYSKSYLEALKRLFHDYEIDLITINHCSFTEQKIEQILEQL